MNIEQIKQQRRQSLRISDRQLMEAFPEAATVLADQLKRLNGSASLLKLGIKIKCLSARAKTKDEFSLWFYDQLIDATHGRELRSLQKQISVIKRRLNILAGVTIPGQLTDEAIAHAKEQPIEQLLSEPLRPVGQRLMGRCPLHEDKIPSFVVYKTTNTCWCFGCSTGGDTIKLTQLLHGYSFKQAVNYLNNY